MQEAKLWRPSPGDIVQIWDRGSGSGNLYRIAAHGVVGYVVRQSGHDPTSGPIFQVKSRCNSKNYHVWHGWLRQIKNVSDVKKVLDKP